MRSDRRREINARIIYDASPELKKHNIRLRNACHDDGQYSGEVRQRGGQGRQLGTTIQSILDELKPEAVYFAADNGDAPGLSFSICVMPVISRRLRNRGCLRSTPALRFSRSWCRAIWPRPQMTSRRPSRIRLMPSAGICLFIRHMRVVIDSAADDVHCRPN